MKLLKHLPSIAFFLAAIAFMLWFFRFSLTSDDLRPWLAGFLCLSVLVGFAVGRWVSRRLPSPYQGVATGIIAVGVGVFVHLALGWPLAELVTAELREMRGYQSDLGNTYFYHDFSGMGAGDLFNFYPKTIAKALTVSGILLIAAFLACPILSIPYLLANRGKSKVDLPR